MAAYSSIIIKYLDKSTPIFLRHFEQACVCPDAWPVGLITKMKPNIFLSTNTQKV